MENPRAQAIDEIVKRFHERGRDRGNRRTIPPTGVEFGKRPCSAYYENPDAFVAYVVRLPRVQDLIDAQIIRDAEIAPGDASTGRKVLDQLGRDQLNQLERIVDRVDRYWKLVQGEAPCEDAFRQGVRAWVEYNTPAHNVLDQAALDGLAGRFLTEARATLTSYTYNEDLLILLLPSLRRFVLEALCRLWDIELNAVLLTLNHDARTVAKALRDVGIDGIDASAAAEAALLRALSTMPQNLTLAATEELKGQVRAQVERGWNPFDESSTASEDLRGRKMRVILEVFNQLVR